jgi:hypothetical protein
LATGHDGISDRRRGNARALADRLHTQPDTDDRRLAPDHKELLIDWREGERWFGALVDIDCAKTQ